MKPKQLIELRHASLAPYSPEERAMRHFDRPPPPPIHLGSTPRAYRKNAGSLFWINERFDQWGRKWNENGKRGKWNHKFISWMRTRLIQACFLLFFFFFCVCQSFFKRLSVCIWNNLQFVSRRIATVLYTIRWTFFPETLVDRDILFVVRQIYSIFIYYFQDTFKYFPVFMD